MHKAPIIFFYLYRMKMKKGVLSLSFLYVKDDAQKSEDYHN